MAKFTDRGWGKDDDPMFLEGLKLSYTQKLLGLLPTMFSPTGATPEAGGMDG